MKTERKGAKMETKQKEPCVNKALLDELKRLRQTCERLQEILLYFVSERFRLELGQKQQVPRDAILQGVKEWIECLEKSEHGSK